ncbi:MAG: response regulator [Betaproteobacteria bacterium]|nr:response regulator [Betaproteobacteria bacterium]
MKTTSTFDFGKALQSQARVRLWMVCALVLTLCSVGAASNWLTAPQVAVGTLHLGYALVFYWIQRRKKQISERLLFTTAILDAACIFGWVMVTGPFGILFTPLLNFSTIGYGMRTGSRKVLRVSQGAAFFFACLVPLLSPMWATHMIGWGAVILAVVIVPWYAGELTKQFKAAIEFAERESQAKSELLARVSHELRTPLGGITHAAELLRVEASTVRNADLSKTILDLSEHLLAEINDLLDQSKLTSGKMTLSPEPHPLERVLEIVSASIESRAQAKGLLFHARIDPRLTSQVLIDDHWLVRALINLAGNAVKFTDAGSISLNFILLSESLDDYVIRFSVHDTGIGISPSDQSKIFNPFVQAESGRRHASEGTGLGLAISQEAVRLMGGDLCVASTPGGGSHFWFDLRLEKAPDAPAVPTSSVPTTAPTKLTPPVSGRRILLVDDNSTNLFLLKELLQQDGHSVVTASSGASALTILSHGDRFDLLLLDYNLSDMAGTQLLQIYRMGVAQPAPAFFLTADATLVTERKLGETGARGVLTKPIRIADLRRAIQNEARPTAATSKVCALDQASPLTSDWQTEDDQKVGKHLRAVSVTYIDPAVIQRLQSLGRSKTFLIEMLSRAKADINRSTEAVAAALQHQDAGAARDAAHALKGVCLEIGAIRLTNVSLAIMRSDDAQLESQTAKMRTNLRDVASNTLAAIDGIITQQTQIAASF